MNDLHERAPAAFSAERDDAEWDMVGFVPHDVLKDGALFRSRRGEYFGNEAFLKVPWEDSHHFMGAQAFLRNRAQIHGARREALWLAALRDGRSPTMLRLTPELYDCAGRNSMGYFITSYKKGITPSDDQIRNMSAREQQIVGKTLANVIVEFARAIPEQAYDQIVADAPLGVCDERCELETNAVWESPSNQLDILYDLGYEWLTDAMMLTGREYVELNNAGRLEPTMIGHGNLHGNVMFTYPNRTWQVEAITGLSRVMPSTAACEVAFLYAYGEHALASGMAEYERITGEQVDAEELQFWIRAHAPLACARTILEGRRLGLLQRETLERWIPNIPWDRLPEAADDEWLPLRHTRALCMPIPPVNSQVIGTARGTIWEALNRSLDASITHAKKFGAAIVDIADTATYIEERRAVDPRAAVMYDNPHIVPAEQYAADSEAFFSGIGREIRRPRTLPLAQCDETALRSRLQAGEPFMLAYPEIHRGNCKYLIEEPWQLDRLLQFCTDHPDESWPEALEVRQYIETPSDRFTHYRSLVTAAGEILAAGLVYSRHTKSSGRVIAYDRWEQSDGQSLKLKRAFEDPKTAYYLAARDVRSNAAAGGNVIPLMGPSAQRPFRETARTVLHAHGIDPDRPALPTAIRRTSQLIGRVMGPQLDILLGTDHLVERDTFRDYLAEWNPDPMMGTVVACGLSDDPLQAFIEARLRTVESLPARR